MASTVHIGAPSAAAFLAAMLLSPQRLSAQASHDDVNASDNPLQPALAVNIQNQYIGQLYDFDDTDPNSLLLQAACSSR